MSFSMHCCLFNMSYSMHCSFLDQSVNRQANYQMRQHARLFYCTRQMTHAREIDNLRHRCDSTGALFFFGSSEPTENKRKRHCSWEKSGALFKTHIRGRAQTPALKLMLSPPPREISGQLKIRCNNMYIAYTTIEWTEVGAFSRCRPTINTMGLWHFHSK